MQGTRRGRIGAAILIVAALVGGGCQTLQEFANLRNVAFAFERVAGVELGGVDVSRYRSSSDVAPADLVKIGRALAQRTLPTQFEVQLSAENPPENAVQARLLRMEWTLFLDQKETVSGAYDRETLIPAGGRANIPIRIEMDLVQFFGSNLQNLVDVALGLSGYGGKPVEVMIRARPVIETPVGPIRYPQPITLVRKSVQGGAAGR